MARIYPFHPLRYTAKAGPLSDVVTQPYDKISPAMRSRYLAQSPYNLVRIILGETTPQDSEQDNVYTRAAAHLDSWTASGILARDTEPGIYPYFQEFTVPETNERLVRKGFIALGAVEEYSAGIVHRHEQTLTGPKKDRLELLRHTHAHFGQLFMLYPDPAGAIDALLDEAAAGEPLARVQDEYGATHTIWKIAGAGKIQELMADKKLLIADGHHRYETALAFRNENPELPGADRVMMTFVNMYSPGLKILATHRLVNGLAPDFEESFFQAAAEDFIVTDWTYGEDLKKAWEQSDDRTVIIANTANRCCRLEYRRRGELDVRVLHEKLLGKALGISEQAVRDGKHLRYIRSFDDALSEVQQGSAQIAFLLKPTSVQQVADTSFGGGVMPQKSTDFYPKLLSGLTIYKLE
ncbi:MAG: DUF1015 domain-containing protein [Ignavibacteriota bacterium]